MKRTFRNHWNVRDSIKRIVRTPRHLFTLFDTFKTYRLLDAKKDLRAAFNVSVLSIPQAIAYAMIAGVPPVYGVLCASIAPILNALFSSSRQTILGPSNATAFLIFSFFIAYPELSAMRMMPFICAFTGIILMIAAVLRLADLVQYISRSVMIGYLTACALLIIVNQLSNLVGSAPSAFFLEKGHEPPARNFFTILGQNVQQLSSIELASVLITLLTVLNYYLLKKFFPKLPTFAFSLILPILAGLFFRQTEFSFASFSPFYVKDMFISPPPLAPQRWLDEFGRIGGLAFAVAFLSAMENTVVGKNIANRQSRPVDLNQDLFAQGLSNIGCAFLAPMPASGSPSRTTLNSESGAITQFSAIFAGILSLVFAILVGPHLDQVPKAAIASLVVLNAFSLINRRMIRISLVSTRSDAITLVGTLIATLLLPLHIAIFVGVGISIALYLRESSRPELVEYAFNDSGELMEAQKGQRPTPGIAIVHVEGNLYFGAADLFRSQLLRISLDDHLKILILRLKHAHLLDATSVMALEELVLNLRKMGKEVIISGAMKNVYRVLKKSGLVEIIGRQNIFPGSASNPNLATRNALKRAQKILGEAEPQIHVYYDPNQKTGN